MITGIVLGIASLVIVVIIAFVIVSTMTGANLLTATRTSATVSNESTGGVNATGYTVDGASVANVVSGSYVLTEAYTDVAGTPLLIPLANVSISSSGVVTNATVTTYDSNATVSYTYNIESSEEVSASFLAGNLTAGVDNVSSKIPTVLLVAAIVLILGVLVLLVATWQKMRMGGGGI